MLEPTIETTPTLLTTAVVDDDGNEYLEYRIEGDLVDADTYERQRLRNAEIHNQQMMDVSRFMDEQHQVEAAVASIEAEKLEERRAAARAELEALGISAETIETMLRGL